MMAMITLVDDGTGSGHSRLVIAQLKNTALILAIILIGVPLASAFLQYQHGELKTWTATGDALQHGLFDAFWTAVGWLLFKSPWGATLTEILSHEKSSETMPGGGIKTTDKTIKVTVDKGPGLGSGAVTELIPDKGPDARPAPPAPPPNVIFRKGL